MAKLSIHCFVSGKVQGVFYRAFTQDKAKNLGLTGWVRNLPDGRVELIASGEDNQLKALFESLKEGPQRSNVTDVTYEEIPYKEFARFSVL